MSTKKYLLLGLGATLFTQSVGALDPKDYLSFSLGKTTFVPRLNVATSFSDNVFFNDLAKLSDVIVDVGPGFGVRLGAPGGNSLVFGYQFDQLLYLDHNQFDAQNHAVQLSGHYEGGRFDYTGSASISYLTTVIGGALNDPLLLGSGLKVARWPITTSHMLDYTLSEKTGLYLGPTYSSTDYELGTPLLDVTDFRITPGFRYNLTPKTKIFGETYYGQATLESNSAAVPKGPSSDVFGGFAGVSFEVSAKITGTLKGGYETRSFENRGAAPSEPVFDVGLSYKIAPKTAWSFSYGRRSQVSVQGAGETAIVNSLTTSVNQAIGNTGKLNAVGSLSYQTSSYESASNASRSFDYFSLNFGLFYNFQLWLKSGINYSHIQTSSDSASVIQYTENRVSLTVSIGY